MTDQLWQTKLAAWLHDPAEKALVLLRDSTGHEWGTVADLREQIFGHRAMPQAAESFVRRADWYAAAADRPQWPLEDDGRRYRQWTQVDFAKRPVLKHPLTGADIDLQAKLEDVPLEDLKSMSRRHFEALIVRDDEGAVDPCKTLLAFWRFGPEIPATEDNALKLGGLWRNLPADTRVPDHSIWQHLDLVSGLAGAMAADNDHTPALLAVSFGPVQSFITEARATSDLWAGSHLLARIAWEGMRVVCQKCGPDAVLFPNLRGVPQVDLWLREQLQAAPELTQRFDAMEWRKLHSDANPLFAATLPNRFVAIVPAARVKALADEIANAVRAFMRDLGVRSVDKLLETIGAEGHDNPPCREQVQQQLEGFPEVYWAAVPWSLAEGAEHGGKHPVDDGKLRTAMAGFYPQGSKIGFLDSEAWRVLRTDIQDLDGAKFFAPNPGALYPALYDLLDRVAAAAKTARPFTQCDQSGYRSSLNGEREWLTLDRKQLDRPPGQRKDTLWTRVAEEKPSWAKKGEHLDGLAAIKRLWPTLFVEALRDNEPGEPLKLDLRRYVVSTHSLALATSLERWLRRNPRPQIPDKLRNLLESQDLERTALPKRLVDKLRDDSDDARLLCHKLPGLLDSLQDRLAAEDEPDANQHEQMLRCAQDAMQTLFGAKPEAYYGMILFDGDRMGAWLAGNEPDFQLRYRDTWHPEIRANVDARFGENEPLQAYLHSPRPASPARHRAISEALNHFSLRIARFVVEDCFKGKLIYAGGDDLLAFICVDDLLPTMTVLRCVYSGRGLPDWLRERMDADVRRRLDSKNGWVRLDGELLPTMGNTATASAGAVVAHHQAPLAYVLRELRSAEARAKNEGGRDAFCLRVLKRAGGEAGVTDKWFATGAADYPACADSANTKDAPGLLAELIAMLGRPKVSRRAAYHSAEWLRALPQDAPQEMIAASLAHQFERQGGDRNLAERLAAYACRSETSTPADWLSEALTVAEFLARACRNPSGNPDLDNASKDAA